MRFVVSHARRDANDNARAFCDACTHLHAHTHVSRRPTSVGVCSAARVRVHENTLHVSSSSACVVVVVVSVAVLFGGVRTLYSRTHHHSPHCYYNIAPTVLACLSFCVCAQQNTRLYARQFFGRRTSQLRPTSAETLDAHTRTKMIESHRCRRRRSPSVCVCPYRLRWPRRRHHRRRCSWAQHNIIIRWRRAASCACINTLDCGVCVCRASRLFLFRRSDGVTKGAKYEAHAPNRLNKPVA